MPAVSCQSLQRQAYHGRCTIRPATGSTAVHLHRGCDCQGLRAGRLEHPQPFGIKWEVLRRQIRVPKRPLSPAFLRRVRLTRRVAEQATVSYCPADPEPSGSALPSAVALEVEGAEIGRQSRHAGRTRLPARQKAQLRVRHRVFPPAEEHRDAPSALSTVARIVAEVLASRACAPGSGRCPQLPVSGLCRDIRGRGRGSLPISGG